MGDIMDTIKDVEEIWYSTTMGDKISNLKWKNDLIKELLQRKTKIGEKERNILYTIMELEEFMEGNKGLCIQQADKGKITILMKRKEFTELANKFMDRALNEGLYRFMGEIDSEKLDMIPKKEIALLRRRVAIWRKCGIFKIRNERNISIESQYWERINTTQQQIPRMKFIIKAHKEGGLEIRNICPKNRTWTYQLGQVLCEFLEDTLKKKLLEIKHTNHNIDNIQDFALFIQEYPIEEDEEIVSIDIKEMFNEINTKKLIDIINRYVDTDTYNNDTIKDMIEYDIRESNWAIYNKRLYKQHRGIPMGAPTSTLYAKLYLDYFITLNKTELEKAGMRKLFKYVDDIFIIAKKNQVTEIIKILGRETKLEFKIEEKKNDKTTFLDMSLNVENGKIKTRKNKKEYTSNRTINAMSTQSLKTKLATIQNKLIRAINLTSPEYLYDTLMESIEELINNGYYLKTLEKSLKTIIGKLKLKNAEDTNKKLKRINEKIIITEDCVEAINTQRRNTIRQKTTYNMTITAGSKSNQKQAIIHKSNANTQKKKNYKKYRGPENKYIRITHKDNQTTKFIKGAVGRILKSRQKYTSLNKNNKTMKKIIMEKAKERKTKQ